MPGGPKPAAAKPATVKPAATSPRPASTAPTAGAAGANAPTAGAAPAAPAKGKPTVADLLKKPEVKKYGSAAIGLLLLVGLFIWRPWSPRPPRLNEDPAVIAKFAASNIQKVPFEQQRQYMELLDEKDKRVEEAYEQGQLSDQEFRRALQLAWYGEHLKKMDSFYAKPPTLRLMYLDKQVEKKRKKKLKNKGEKPDDQAALKADANDRDDSTEEADVQRLPPDVRQRWTDYRAAFAARKQYWKDQKDQHKAQQETAKSHPNGAAAPGQGTGTTADASKGVEPATPPGPTAGGQQ
jgi:hypothetical protein